MSVTREAVLEALERIELPDGGTLVSRDMVRALEMSGDTVRFVIEAESPEQAQRMGAVRDSAEAAVAALEGVRKAQVMMTAHGPAAKPSASPQEAPSLKIGRHPDKASGKQKVTGVDRIIAVASGKGGVGKSTVAANLAVALARQGRRVGLLDADIYGPSQPRMMGVNRRPASPDGKIILPLEAHGVTLMSIGFMLDENKPVIWRGPMLMGALQQLLTQVRWGELDVLIVDMPPGTGDIQLTLCTYFDVTGALVVSTPQDVALLDARKALTAFTKLGTEIIGLIENMSTYICPECGHEAHIFGHGGVRAEADKLGLPLLSEIPLSLDVREAGDGGTPIALGEGPIAETYGRLAARLIAAAQAKADATADTTGKVV